jgi:hypothetical protein
MIYAEASYFDGYHFHHIGVWEDFQLRKRRRAEQLSMIERRQRRR